MYNFSAGPSKLPAEVLVEAQQQLLDYQQMGASILEISHRSKEYEKVHEEAKLRVRRLLALPDDYEVLFMHGGASTQFSMIPLNFLTAGKTAGYIHSGTWSGKAQQEASKIGHTIEVASGVADKFTRLPVLLPDSVPAHLAYVHMTSNETIGGIQYQALPEVAPVPLIVDMSSDIMSRPMDVTACSLIYAGAQKNLGPAGVTMVIVKRSLLEQTATHIPDIFSYAVHAKHQSLYNTPPVFSIYLVNLVLQWIENQGGLLEMERRNQKKAALVYDAIDNSYGFYEGLVEPNSRSIMNVTFKVNDRDLEAKLLQALEEEGFSGLKGHRDAGHLRASLYNAVTYEQCKALTDFLHYFQMKYN